MHELEFFKRTDNAAEFIANIEDPTVRHLHEFFFFFYVNFYLSENAEKVKAELHGDRFDVFVFHKIIHEAISRPGILVDIIDGKPYKKFLESRKD